VPLSAEGQQVRMSDELQKLITWSILEFPISSGASALDRTDITIQELIHEGGVVIVSFKTAIK